MPRKPIQKYYYSVEGETEAYYLKWLAELINREPNSVTHVCDVESNEPIHVNAFKETLTLLKEAARQGKQVDYLLGYSNFTFELWMILHKIDCFRSFSHRRQYLEPINRAFQEHFYELSEYKREADFNRILRKISLEDVKLRFPEPKSLCDEIRKTTSGLRRTKAIPTIQPTPL